MLRSAECARPIRPVTQRPSAEGLSEQAQSALLARSRDRRGPRILGSQATEKRCVGRTVEIGALWAVDPRDTLTGVGVGRKTGSEAGEAIRWGRFLSRRLGVG